MVIGAHTGPKYTVLRALANMRLDDARCLWEFGVRNKQPQRRNGAVYLAGYAVECALKAKICMERGDAKLDTAYFVHGLVWLARQTSLWHRRHEHRENWRELVALAGVWEPGLRYETRFQHASDVERLLVGVRRLIAWVSGS
jgi:hypothetical protein